MAIISLKYNGDLGSFITVDEFLFNRNINLSTKEFLDFKNDKTGMTNREIIWKTYSKKSKINLGFIDKDGNILQDENAIDGKSIMPIPIRLWVDSEKININLLVNESNLNKSDLRTVEIKGKGKGKNVIDLGGNLFKNEIDILNAFQFESDTPWYNRKTRKAVSKPHFFIWPKSMNIGSFNPNSIIDITPFLENFNFNQSMNGANFSINLANIEGELTNDEFQIWVPNKKSYLKIKNQFYFKTILNRVGETIVEKYDKEKGKKRKRYQNQRLNGINIKPNIFFEKEKGVLIRSKTLWKNLFSENDVFFVAFFSEEFDKVDDFFINSKTLSEADSFLTIGLLDKISESINFEGNVSNVSLQGRDLMKLLIEDGSYFFTKSFSQSDDKSIFENIEIDGRGDDENTMNKAGNISANRLITTGILEAMLNPTARNIEFIMNFVISKLSNIEVCDSRLFENFSDLTEFSIPVFEEKKVNENDEIYKD